MSAEDEIKPNVWATAEDDDLQLWDRQHRRCFTAAIIFSVVALLVGVAIVDEPLIASIFKETLWRNGDGQSRTWFHPRACMMPGRMTNRSL